MVLTGGGAFLLEDTTLCGGGVGFDLEEGVCKHDPLSQYFSANTFSYMTICASLLLGYIQSYLHLLPHDRYVMLA